MSTVRTFSYGARPPTQNENLVIEQISLAHKYYNKLIETEKEKREKMIGVVKDSKKADAIKEKYKKKVRQARADCGVYWGTYLVIEDSVNRAMGTSKLKFRRWDGSGIVAVQIQHGFSVAELLACDDRRCRLYGEGKYRELWLRIGSKKSDPIWAVFPIKYHRDIPSTAKIKWVRLVKFRIGTHYKWKAQFIIDVDEKEIALPKPTKDTIGIDIGWRVRPDGIRVAYWYDGRDYDELVIPQRIIDRYKKTEDLQSIRDKNFNETRNRFCAVRKEQKEKWPQWLIERTQHIQNWRSQGKMAAMIIQWRHNRFDGDDEIFNYMEAWRKQDKHLLEWQANQRRNCLNARLYLYRQFAKKISQYKHVIIEDIDLRRFAKLPGKNDEPDSPATKNARPNRFKSNLSELLSALVDAVKRAGGIVSEAPAEFTTLKCSWCDFVNDFDAAKSIEQKCLKCGRAWDQDLNAARNLYRAATCCTEPGRRFGKKKKTKSKVNQRRQEGKRKKLSSARNNGENNNVCAVL